MQQTQQEAPATCPLGLVRNRITSPRLLPFKKGNRGAVIYFVAGVQNAGPVEDAQKREKIASDCVLDFTYNANTLSHAPALVALTMVTGRSGFERDGSYSSPLEGHWQSFDAGIAAQTFCLAAHALGLGTVIMGIYDPDKVAKVLSVPEGQTVAALIAIGHPAQDPAAPARKSVEELLSVQ